MTPGAAIRLTTTAAALLLAAGGVGAQQVVAGAPRQFVVATIPVPPALADAPAVTYTVAPTGTVQLLGARTGVLARRDGGMPRAVLLTIGIPAAAPHGPLDAAVVSFTAPGRPVAQVPLVADVAHVRDLALAAAQRLRGARAGATHVVAFVLHNRGNGDDTVSTRVELPTGWQVAGAAEQRVAMPRGTERVVELRVAVPRQAAGTARVTLWAEDGGGRRVRADADLEVAAREASRAAGGPLLTTGLALTSGSDEGTAAAARLAVAGPLSPGVRATGEYIGVTGRSSAGDRGLAAAGYLAPIPYLVLEGADWRVNAGAAGGTLGQLAGTGIWGAGVSASARVRGADWSALAARPLDAAPGDAMLAAGGGVPVGQVRVTTMISHLRGGETDHRRLDAVTFGAAGSASFGEWTAELGHRSYEGGAGLGVATTLERRLADGGGLLSARLLHAPGGSGAFALARDELSGFASLRVSRRLTMAMTGWTTRDANRSFSQLRTSGLTLHPQWAPTDALSAGVTLSASRFSAEGTTTGFGSSELGGLANASARWRAVTANLSTGYAALTRSVALLSGASATDDGGRWTLRLSARAPARWANVGVRGGLETYGGELRGSTRQRFYGVTVDNLALPLGGEVTARLSNSLDAYDWFGDRRGATVWRSAVSVGLPGDYSAELGVERSGLFLDRAGRPSWVTTFKLERGASLPPLPRFGRRGGGIVYRDYDADGRRDADEPGFAGLIVRREGESIVTDDDGRFQFTRPSERQWELDAATVPFGWILPPRGSAGADPRQFGLIPTRTQVLRLVLRPRGDGYIPRVRWGGAGVTATDSAGVEWYARVDDAGTATFDALPPGRYTVTLWLQGVGEPLVPVGDLPAFRVDAQRPADPIDVPLSPRPLRFFVPSTTPRGGDAAASPSAPPAPARP